MKFKNLFIIFFMITGLKTNAQDYIYVWTPSFIEHNYKEEVWLLNKKTLPEKDSTHHHHSQTNKNISVNIPELTFHFMDVKGIYFKLENVNLSDNFYIKINSKNGFKKYEIKDLKNIKNGEYYLDLSAYKGNYLNISFVINETPKNNVKLLIRKDYV